MQASEGSWDLLAGAAGSKILWQTAETLQYMLRLEGLSRVLSHQLVRARVGWTFSETCTGDHDWRHGDFLIPRNWTKLAYGYESRLAHMIESKLMYAACVDSGEAPNTARYVLHPNLKVYVHASVNLAALAAWYAKRSCTMTQSWEMVILAEKVKEKVVEATPWAAPAFRRPCPNCWYAKAKGEPLNRATYYKPDKIHDTLGQGPSLYDKTSWEMCSGDPVDTRWYVGATDVTKRPIGSNVDLVGVENKGWFVDPVCEHVDWAERIGAK